MLPLKALEAAEIVAKVDLSQQRMQVFIQGKRKYVWRVSTGKKGWQTPTGNFQPYKTYRNYYEKRWKSNLPYLVMINSSKGIGIHGTHQSGRLGRPASHGCIRLSVGNAAKFYSLVQKHGLYNSRVTVHP
jgi:lipoprotein-anchoring transpeptidase ErfK/SrfK